MESFRQDVRYGLRSLRKNPGFTIVAALTLALGIGANTAIFSVVNAVLLRQLPFHEPERLVHLESRRPEGPLMPFNIPDFMDYREQSRAVEQIAAYAGASVNLTGRGEAERLQGLRVSANFFQTLGVSASAGRLLEPEDDIPGHARAAVISYGFWQRRFGGDTNLIGQPLNLNGLSYTVVGVLPRHFLIWTRDIDVVIPMVPDADPWRNNRGSVSFLFMLGRLKPGVLQAQAETELTAIALRLKQQFPEANSQKTGVMMQPLADRLVGSFRLSLWVLLGAVGAVLLIACANLANLWLVQASTRHREMAVRTALGASRTRLIRQLLTESVLIAALGGVLGLALAAWGVRVLVAMSPANLPRANEIGLDARVLLFTAFVSILAGLLSGLTPALQVSRGDLNEALREGGRGSSDSRKHGRTRNLLVAAEVALSLMLLAGAGLFLKSFMRLEAVRPGFSTDRVLALRLSLPKNRYKKPEDIFTFQEKLRPRLEGLPGVQSVGVISALPMSGVWASVDFQVVGRPAESPDKLPDAQYRAATPGYMRTMGIPLLTGRDFNEHDNAAGAQVILINEEFARRYWPNASPVGAHIKHDDSNGEWHEAEIVGVVGNVKHLGLEDEASLDVYVPFEQIPQSVTFWMANNQFWLLHTATEPMSLADAARREIRGVDADVATTSTRTMEQYLATSIAPRRFNLFLLGVFAVAAVLLAAAGIFGVISFAVARRTHEIGIRMALGAQPGDVFRLIVGESLRVAGIGIAVGLAGALALTRVLTGLLFGVSATDPAVFACVAAVLGGVALFAAALPARRATRVDAIVALHYE
jgi:putative ABC transport system permease protein